MNSYLDKLESVLLEVAARSAPWLVPILPAYTVGNALHEHLEVWPAVAITGGVAFELVGIASTKNALRCWAWNSTRRKSDPSAPFALAVFLSLIYFVTGIGLSVALEVWPALTVFAPASYFVLAGSSYFVLAIGNNLSRWTNDKLTEKAARNDAATIRELTDSAEKLTSERDNLAAELSDLKGQFEALQRQKEPTNGQMSPAQADKMDSANAARMTKREVRMTEALSLFRQGLSVSEVADNLSVSERTALRYQAELNGAVTK